MFCHLRHFPLKSHQLRCPPLRYGSRGLQDKFWETADRILRKATWAEMTMRSSSMASKSRQGPGAGKAQFTQDMQSKAVMEKEQAAAATLDIQIPAPAGSGQRQYYTGRGCGQF
jgi:hypothetical protein